LAPALGCGSRHVNNSALFEDACEYDLFGLAVFALSAQFFSGFFQFTESDWRLA
jgi:hypothetical protein